MSRARVVRIGAGAALAVTLSGCFTTTADYRQEAERFIVEDSRIRTELGVTMASAVCDDPVDQQPGTTFSCTAVDTDGEAWGFEVEIADDNRFGVSVSSFP